MINKTDLKIGVIGYKGMVGSNVFRWFKEKGYNVMGTSRKTKTRNWKLGFGYYFICVPTPYDWKKKKVDISGLEAWIKILNEQADLSIVVIKSTVPPETTKRLQQKYKRIHLLFNPEFLSEKTAWSDFINPDRQIIGVTDRSKGYAITILNMLPISSYDMIIPSTEAEIVKYVNNFHGSLMVIFSNFIYDLSQKLNANYEDIRDASEASKWVGSPMGRMYWNVFHAGFRGYGGKCFPKDMNTLLEYSKKKRVKSEILEAMIAANKRILRKQKMSEKDAEGRSSRT